MPWDTEIFGFPVAQINRIELAEGADPTEVLDGFDGWCAEHAVRLVSCRLDHGRLRESMALEAAGFRFVEMVYGPRFDRFDAIGTPRHDVAAHRGDAKRMSPAIEAIASSAFTTGRFLLDERLDPELSRPQVRDVGADELRVGPPDGAQGGARRASSSASSSWSVAPTRACTGTSPRSRPSRRARASARASGRRLLLRHRAEGATSVETTISGHNLPIINLYARLGFSFASAQMTFHRLRDADR